MLREWGPEPFPRSIRHKKQRFTLDGMPVHRKPRTYTMGNSEVPLQTKKKKPNSLFFPDCDSELDKHMNTAITGTVNRTDKLGGARQQYHPLSNPLLLAMSCSADTITTVDLQTLVRLRYLIGRYATIHPIHDSVRYWVHDSIVPGYF